MIKWTLRLKRLDSQLDEHISMETPFLPRKGENLYVGQPVSICKVTEVGYHMFDSSTNVIVVAIEI
jgi:hypothetical protein